VVTESKERLSANKRAKRNFEMEIINLEKPNYLEI
jgi:hypothetical protein